VISVSVSAEIPPDTEEVLLNEYWVIKIRDNGSGVSSEQLTKLNRFEPGIRFRKGIGHGHGLTAAQRYMASLGGRVTLYSELGKYFEVALYLRKSEPGEKRPEG
jgi:signal transduction histidine kinase